MLGHGEGRETGIRVVREGLFQEVTAELSPRKKASQANSERKKVPGLYRRFWLCKNQKVLLGQSVRREGEKGWNSAWPSPGLYEHRFSTCWLLSWSTASYQTYKNQLVHSLNSEMGGGGPKKGQVPSKRGDGGRAAPWYHEIILSIQNSKLNSEKLSGSHRVVQPSEDEQGL